MHFFYGSILKDLLQHIHSVDAGFVATTISLHWFNLLVYVKLLSTTKAWVKLWESFILWDDHEKKDLPW